MLYSVTKVARGEVQDNRKGPNSIYLEGFLGVALDSENLPFAHQELMKDQEFLELFNRADYKNELAYWDLTHRPDLQHILMNTSSPRGFGDIPEAAVLCPISYRTHKVVSGVLLVVLSTRRPYDDDYESFIRTLSYEMSSSLASHLLIQDRKRLAQDASQNALEAQQAKSILAVSPVGSFMMSLEGKILYANDAWKSITDYQLDEHYEKSWMSVIHENDHQKMDMQWEKLINEKQDVSFELQLKRTWEDVDSNGTRISGPVYIIAAAGVQKIGNELYVTGAITDISRQKWVEGFEKRQRQEALELKRQQEKYSGISIDCIS
jgi:PAS domain S-box-containing protein